jgi:hypothetical protein
MVGCRKTSRLAEAQRQHVTIVPVLFGALLFHGHIPLFGFSYSDLPEPATGVLRASLAPVLI